MTCPLPLPNIPCAVCGLPRWYATDPGASGHHARLTTMGSCACADPCSACGFELDGDDGSCASCERRHAYERGIASLVTPRGKYAVRLASVGNPDFGQDSRKSLPGVPRQTIRVTSLLAASQACRLYIDYYGLGGGNWIGGEVKSGRANVARISYNGRVWDPNDERIEIAQSNKHLRPACETGMGCLCAGHASGLPSAGRCDATEVA